MALEELINLKLFYFQEPSVIPFVANLDLYAILAVILAGVITFFLAFEKLNQIINLILFPFVAISSFFLFGYLAQYLDVFSGDLSLISVFFDVLKIWPILIIVEVLFKIVYIPISRLLGKISKENRYIQGGFVAPIIEETFYRFVLINSLVMSGVPLFNAFFISAILFGIMHITQIKMGKWYGGSAINYALVMGFIFGFIALYYGIIIAIVLHSVLNIIHNLMIKETKEKIPA